MAGRGSIIEKGEGKWLVRVFVGRDDSGKRRYRSKAVQGGKRAARKALTALLAEKDAGRLPLVRPSATVDEWLDVWLETVARPSVRERTFWDYEADLRRYARPHLGGGRLDRLTPADVRRWLVRLREQGLGARTIKRAHATLRAALEEAVSDGLLRDNPARARLVRKALPSVEPSEPATLGEADIEPFVDACTSDPLGALYMLMGFGGLRPSEALAVRWADLNGDTVSIRRVAVDKPGRPLHYAPPKTAKSRRAVVLPEVVVHELAAHRKRQAAERLAAPEWEDGDLIFADERGAPLRQDPVRRRWNRLRDAVGLPPGLTPYGLRHSAATMLLAAGVPLKIVSERLGHSTITLTGDTYSHVHESMQREAADALQRLVDG